MPIRQPWLDFKTEVIKTLPDSSGVFELGDQAKNIVMIKGADNVQQTLLELKNSGEPSIEKVLYVRFEEEFMYTQRETELLQAYMRVNKKQPECNDEII